MRLLIPLFENGAALLGQRADRFLVALPPERDLLFCAKHLFIADMSWWQLPLQPGLLGPSCRKRMKANLARDKQPALPKLTLCAN